MTVLLLRVFKKGWTKFAGWTISKGCLLRCKRMIAEGSYQQAQPYKDNFQDMDPDIDFQLSPSMTCSN